MNENVKGIVVGAAVLAVLGGAFAVLKLTGADDPGQTESSSSYTDPGIAHEHEEENIRLVDVHTDDIRQIDVKNAYGGFTYLGASESGKDGSAIAELKGLELDAFGVSGIGESIAQLTAHKLVEQSADDLSKYGLSEPEAEFKISFSDGSERSFLVGIEAHDDSYRYLCESGSSDVYMVDSYAVEPFVRRKEELLDNRLLASSAGDGAGFGTLTVSRSDLEYDMVFKTDNGEYERSADDMPSEQVMTEPIFSYLNGTTSTEIIYSLYGLTAMSAEVIFPTEEDLAEYGLDAPHTTVTFVGNGYDYKLSIGGAYHELNDDGAEQTAASAYYCTFEGVEGKDCIWKIDASALPWVDMLPGDIISSMMIWDPVTSVEELKITGEGGADFKLTASCVDEKVQLESVECDGISVDTESFKELYLYIMTCPTSEICFDDPGGEPYLTIEIACAGGNTEKIELLKETGRRSIVKLNGRVSYRIRSTWADRLTENIDAVRSGGTVDMDY